MPGFLQIRRVEAVSICLQRNSSNAESVSSHAEHNSTASPKKRNIRLEPSVLLRAQSEVDFTLKRRRLRPSRSRAYFSPHRKLRLPEKTQCFVQILTFKSHPWCVKTKLLCEATFKFEELKLWAHVFNATVPMQKVCQHMQNTIAQRHQRRETYAFNHQFYCARNPS